MAGGQAGTVTLDRVVASVDGAPITESDVEAQYRLETFLATGHVLAQAADATAFARVQSEVIDQRLLEGELKAYRYNQDAVRRQAAERLAALRKKLPDESAFQAQLRKLGMNQHQLEASIEEQQKILEMIDQRLRPAASVSTQEIEDYYQNVLLPDYTRKGQVHAPSLDEVRRKVREILVQKKINQLLDQWLAELKRDHRVEVLRD
jgi:hypothetical protein